MSPPRIFASTRGVNRLSLAAMACTIAIAVLLVDVRVRGQAAVTADALCVFTSDASPEKLFRFDADVQFELRVDALLSSAGFDRSFTLAAANLPVAAAATAGPDGGMLLYAQDAFAHDERVMTNDPAASAVLCHQLGHLVLHHALTREPGLRKPLELEADQFAGTLLHLLGVSEQVAAESYRAALRKSEPRPTRSDLYPDAAPRVAALRRGWQSLGKSLVSSFAPTQDIPQFTLPPPRASAMADVPRELIMGRSSQLTLGDVAARLAGALEASGYEQLSFYSVSPQGFALVTAVEQTLPTGEPVAGPERFAIRLRAPRVFSLGSYLSALFGSPRGHFRLVVLIVSPVAFAQTQTEISVKQGIDWLWAGLNRLPPSVSAIQFGSEYACTALIYEFVQTSTYSDASVLLPSPITGNQHLRQAGILQHLQ